MKFSLLATVIWAAGFVLNAALFLVLLYKRRYRSVPWFSSWIGFGCLYTITLFIAYRIGSKHVYAVLYWSGAFIDLLFQVAVVLEIARSVLQRSGRWAEGARARLILVGAIAPIVGLGMAWFMTPAAETRLDALEARGSLFTTILICLLISSVIGASQHLGLGWKSHIMRESYGLIVWTLVAFITDTLHAYWRTMGHFTALEDVRMGVSDHQYPFTHFVRCPKECDSETDVDEVAGGIGSFANPSPPFARDCSIGQWLSEDGHARE